MGERRPSYLIAGLVDDLPVVQRALVFDCLDALYAAQLGPVLSYVAANVLSPIPDGPAGDALEARLVDETGRLQPFADLLFRELLWITMERGWTPATRADRAFEVIILAGF